MTTPNEINTDRMVAAMMALDKQREESGLDKGGKRYSMVKDRIRIFREYFGHTFGINTEVEHGGGFKQGAVLIGRAKIMNENGIIIASGHAMEFIGSNEITETSAIEAVETAAIGRALACFGLYGGEYASGDEMVGVDRKKAALRDAGPNTDVNQQQHPQISSGVEVNLYVPDQPFAVWVDLIKETAKVTDIVSAIETPDRLAAYWTRLKEFRSALEQNDPASFSELKAAFSVRNSIMKG